MLLRPQIEYDLQYSSSLGIALETMGFVPNNVFARVGILIVIFGTSDEIECVKMKVREDMDTCKNHSGGLACSLVSCFSQRDSLIMLLLSTYINSPFSFTIAQWLLENLPIL